MSETLPDPPESAISSHQPDSNVRWNFGSLIMDVSCFSIGVAFLEGSSVMPLLLTKLGASKFVIGLYVTVKSLLFNLTPLLIAFYMHARQKHKPILLVICNITRLPLLALPWILAHSSDSPGARSAALFATISLLILWSSGDGMGYVPWMEIVARSFSERLRGRFFATSQLVAGIASLVIAYLVVHPALNGRLLTGSLLVFPMNYAALAFGFAIMMQLSSVGIFMIREPDAPSEHADSTPHESFFHFLRSLPATARSSPIFPRLAKIQLLLGAGAAAAPFYVLYAQETFHLPDSWGANYQVVLALSGMATLPLIAAASERWGMATAIRLIAVVIMLTPICAITIGRFGPAPFSLVFLLMGGPLTWGLWMGISQYMLADAPVAQRPLFIALLNVIYTPAALYPVMGGLLTSNSKLISIGGIPVLFLIVAAITGCGLALSLSLPERKPNAAAR